MPISPIVLQRRHAELGRIRLGNQIPTGSNGRTRPNKLEQFRFTSPSEAYIRDLAALYGGTPQPWNNSSKPEWETYSTADSIPVIAVKGGLSQWMETWSGGGCIHRCDGEKQADGTYCDPDESVEVRKNGKPTRLYVHREAKPTTRLSVMLPELDAIGVWRMETHGWNAAAEIPAVAELATFVGDMVPAYLHLVERRSVKDGQTSRFVVPVLDLRIGAARLREIVAEKSGALPPELAHPQQARTLEAGPSTAPPTDQFASLFDRVAAADTLNDLAEIWHQATLAGLVGPDVNPTPRSTEFFNTWRGRAKQLKTQADTPTTREPAHAQASGDTDDEAAADAVWQQILDAAGRIGMQLEDVTADYAQWSGGVIVAEATSAELRRYLDQLGVPA